MPLLSFGAGSCQDRAADVYLELGEFVQPLRQLGVTPFKCSFTLNAECLRRQPLPPENNVICLLDEVPNPGRFERKGKKHVQGRANARKVAHSLPVRREREDRARDHVLHSDRFQHQRYRFSPPPPRRQQLCKVEDHANDLRVLVSEKIAKDDECFPVAMLRLVVPPRALRNQAKVVDRRSHVGVAVPKDCRRIARASRNIDSAFSFAPISISRAATLLRLSATAGWPPPRVARLRSSAST